MAGATLLDPGQLAAGSDVRGPLVKTSRSDKRIHIMQVTFGMAIGGMERVIMELCRYVDPSKYRLSICCISKRGPLADRMESEGVQVVFCQNQSKFGKYFRGFELGKVFREQKVDLLHTHHMPAFIDSTLGSV